MTVTINGSGTIGGITAGGLPDAIITQPDLAAGVAGNGPAFSAYKNADVTLSNNTLTKVACNVKEFDTSNCFDSTTNYRFTPNVAGYYQVSAAIFVTGSGGNSGYVQCAIYKNGSVFKSTYGGFTTTIQTGGASISTVIYFNGSTDYVELYARQNTSVSQSLNGNSNDNFFAAALVRAA